MRRGAIQQTEIQKMDTLTTNDKKSLAQDMFDYSNQYILSFNGKYDEETILKGFSELRQKISIGENVIFPFKASNGCEITDIKFIVHGNKL
jgi:hypothetical protein